MRLPSAVANTMPAAREVSAPVPLSSASAAVSAPSVAMDIRRAWKCTMSSSDR